MNRIENAVSRFKEVRWSRFSDRKVPLNKVETDLVTQGIFTLSS
jgi:hypothetical protein